MATHGWGSCPRCGTKYPSLMMRGICDGCRDKEAKRAMMDRIATPEKLRHHPDLAELDKELDRHYG